MAVVSGSGGKSCWRVNEVNGKLLLLGGVNLRKSKTQHGVDAERAKKTEGLVGNDVGRCCFFLFCLQPRTIRSRFFFVFFVFFFSGSFFLIHRPALALAVLALFTFSSTIYTFSASTTTFLMLIFTLRFGSKTQTAASTTNLPTVALARNTVEKSFI